jgi:hypothetical protein
MEKKPTIKDIKKRFKSYEDHYGQLHEDQKEIDTYYELDFDADVPSLYPTRTPPTARNWVDVGVRHFTLDNPKSKVPPRNDSESAREQVSLLETLYNFWLRKDIIIIKRAAKKLLKRGEVFLKVNMDDTYFGSESPERLFHFPLFLSSPEPINTFASPAHAGLVPHDVIESYDITASEAEALCETNGWKWTTTKKPDKSVTWLSYISGEWRCFLLDDEPVLSPEVQPNIFKFCPYVHIDAGFGDDNYEGKAEYLYRSILWPLRDMLKLEVRKLSAIDAINARYSWPRYKATLDNVQARDELGKLYPGGNVPTNPMEWLYEIKDRAEISIQQGEQPPTGLFEEYAMIQAQAQPPAVLSGLRPTGVYSGQHQEDLMSTAKPIYKDPIKNIESALGVSMGMGTKILETVYDYPVQIKNFSGEGKQYMQIKPSDIKGHYDCEVELLAEPPEATDQRKILGMQLRRAGTISEETELKDYHDMSQKEIDDEQAWKLVDLIMKEPAMLEQAMLDAMTRLGMEKERAALEQAKAEANKQIVQKKPPIRQGEGISRPAPTRGRTAGFEATATPQEGEVGRE